MDHATHRLTRPVTLIAALAVLASALAACGPTTRPTPVAVSAPQPAAAPQIIWARKDGRRMATDPILFEQGRADQQTCEARASAGGALDFTTFASCMDQKGYYRRS